MMQGARGGSFLEIGAGDPQFGNNTHLLETYYDFRGISIEMVTPDYENFFTQWYHEIRHPEWPDQDFLFSTVPLWLKSEIEKQYALDQYARYHDHSAAQQRNELAERWQQIRPHSNLITQNAFDVDYDQWPVFFTYLQIDIEPPEHNLAILQKLCQHKRFAVITFEHDYYLGTTGAQSALRESRELLSGQGYVMVADRIQNFEDWWVDPAIIPEHVYRYYQNVDDTIKTPHSVLYA
jgi:hypothetical protein